MPGDQSLQRPHCLLFMGGVEPAAFFSDGGFERLQAFVAHLRGKDDVQSLDAMPVIKTEPRPFAIRRRRLNALISMR